MPTAHSSGREMKLSEKVKQLDRQYQVSGAVNQWWLKMQAAGKQVEDSVNQQILHWQRTQRLKEEQQQVRYPTQDFVKIAVREGSGRTL